jgi:hypothetical protein
MNNLNHLIQDCLKAYSDESYPSSIDTLTSSSVQSSPNDISLNLFSFKCMTPVEASMKVQKAGFNCMECDKSFAGNRQLSRHQKMHYQANKYSCTIVGCKKTSHRMDGIRYHIRSHERRLLKRLIIDTDTDNARAPERMN